jgi:hypothetical protein
MIRSRDKERIDFTDFVIALGINVAFLVVAALPLWALDRGMLTFSLAKGYGVLWLALIIASLLLASIHKVLRMNLYDRFDAFLITNTAVGGVLVAGWSAFAALSVRVAAAEVAFWKAGILYLIGLVSCWIAFNVATPFFTGWVYRFSNLITAAASFVLFALFPAAARVIFSWFFAFFGFVR